MVLETLGQAHGAPTTMRAANHDRPQAAVLHQVIEHVLKIPTAQTEAPRERCGRVRPATLEHSENANHHGKPPFSRSKQAARALPKKRQELENRERRRERGRFPPLAYAADSQTRGELPPPSRQTSRKRTACDCSYGCECSAAEPSASGESLLASDKSYIKLTYIDSQAKLVQAYNSFTARLMIGEYPPPPQTACHSSASASATESPRTAKAPGRGFPFAPPRSRCEDSLTRNAQPAPRAQEKGAPRGPSARKRPARARRPALPRPGPQYSRRWRA